MLLNMTYGSGDNGITIPNGVEKTYESTDTIAKGSFVELATTGVDIPAFIQIATLDLDASSGVSDVAVLSPKLIVIVYDANTSYNHQVFAKAAVKQEDGNWSLGAAVTIATYATRNSYDAAVVKCSAMNSNTAAVCAGGASFDSSHYYTGASFIIILDVTADGVITVKQKKDIYYPEPAYVTREGENIIFGYTADNPMLTKINETTCAIATKFVYSDDRPGIAVGSFTYSNGVLTVPSNYVGLVDSTSDNSYTTIYSLSKLNDNACVVVYQYNSTTYRGAVCSIAGASISKVTDWVQSANGDYYGYIENNICFSSNNRSLRRSVWNGSTFAHTPIGLSANVSGYTAILKAADNKWYVIGTRGQSMASGSISTVYAINILDSSYSGAAVTTIPYLGFDCRCGLMVLSNRTAVVVAPVINTTTAKLSSSRIDGVALSDAVPTENVIVCTL